jgi:DNA invertase Pin-like site-specific DNA recombinase
MNERKQFVLAFARSACAEPSNKKLQEQRKNILSYAKQKGISIDAFIEAAGKPGTAVLKQMMICLPQKRDTLIVTDFSRISRSLIDVSRIMDILSKREINLLLTGFDNSEDK